jgi:predicted RNA-binding protein YlqC (UPF0109 family)
VLPVAAELAALLRLLVDDPASVLIEEVRDEGVTVFEVRVAPADVGKLVGRRGRTVRALRSLLAARGERDGAEYDLEVLSD